MPKTRDFSNVIPDLGDLDVCLPNGKPMTDSQISAQYRAIGEGDYEAYHWIWEGGVPADDAVIGEAARDALLAVNDRWSLTALRSLFQVRAYHWGFRQRVAARREANRA